MSESIASNGFLPAGSVLNEDDEDKSMLITKKTAEGHSLTALINRQLQGACFTITPSSTRFIEIIEVIKKVEVNRNLQLITFRRSQHFHIIRSTYHNSRLSLPFSLSVCLSRLDRLLNAIKFDDI